MWDLLHRAYPDAARQLAHPHGALRTSSRFRDDLTDRDIERIVLAWRHHAADIIESVHRALMSSPYTLRAIAAGAPNPVHGSERPALAATVSRRLLILGFEPNQVAERRITYAAVDAIRDALTRLTP